MNNRRIVCAANKVNDHIICGVRHYDLLMRDSIERLDEPFSSANVVQGFVDNQGIFLTREEAWVVAESAGQIIQRGFAFDGVRLFSENLY